MKLDTTQLEIAVYPVVFVRMIWTVVCSNAGPNADAEFIDSLIY